MISSTVVNEGGRSGTPPEGFEVERVVEGWSAQLYNGSNFLLSCT